MAQTDSALFTVIMTSVGDDPKPTAYEFEYTNTNTQVVKGNPQEVGTSSFTNIVGAINGTDGTYVVHNQDATNFIIIELIKSGADTARFKLPPGAFHVINGTQIEVSETGSAFGSFVDIDGVTAKADTAACDVAIFKIQIKA